ncbi:precorrin-2 dehydrogenase/sirohydrochlorin ferrochelatase family protein [Paenibacillus pectinilyticus]|uniref:precorrin-2 dehydrogenase/sirohydrochlorin ferrochelatase family protein n=1 Tax=Paenibacillus pectinilyticus TaxID=512399 RepID=UPI000AA87C22|nr:bifunctional precorrin-2 dehydrogenase/sirohydrochlorin ferrochelatase [Paenibacillus pectinilyticus]
MKNWQHPYPLMLNLSGRSCLVVGGGPIAERKVRGLLAAGANVTVISEEFTTGIQAMAERTDVVLYRQTFDAAIVQASDKERFTLVIAATNQMDVNTQIALAAQAQGYLVSVVDQPELSSFILPSVVRRGKLVITVSTGGASPSAARKIAKEIDNAYGDEYEIYLDFLSETRLLIQQRVANKEARQHLFKDMLSWDVMSLIRNGTFEGWKKKFEIALQGASWMQQQETEEDELPTWSFIDEIG